MTSGKGDDDRGAYPREVRRRVNRMRSSGKRRPEWLGLSQVGVLAWVFLIPTLGGLLLGRALWHWGGPAWLRLAGLGLGLLAGAYAAWRQIQRSIEDEEKGP